MSVDIEVFLMDYNLRRAYRLFYLRDSANMVIVGMGAYDIF